jgi:uncharacterized protein
MKIAIISDIHDNIANLKKFLEWCGKNNIEKIICCGDLTNGDTLLFLVAAFFGEIFLVRGNADNYDEDELVAYQNITYGKRTAVWEIGGQTIGACHEPFLIDEVLGKGKCQAVFYGHTHKPWIEEKDGARIINPGTLGGVFYRASFAVWDTTMPVPELKIL